METKTLDLTFARFCNENAELAKRNAKAEEYSAKVNNKKNNKRKAINHIITGVLACVVVGTGIYAISTMETRPNRYAIASSEQSNGNHYIYVTERICEVTEINGDLVTIEYNGQLYDFYGYGYEVGQKIVCQFTDDWEVVGVVE